EQVVEAGREVWTPEPWAARQAGRDDRVEALVCKLTGPLRWRVYGVPSRTGQG
ncbi:MAG: hypothetical protein ACI9MC_004010, partial [Kiritimatiellia bacterium]